MASEPFPPVDGTFVAHLQWVEEQLDKSIAISGIESGWFESFGAEEVEWTSDVSSRYTILGALLPRACTNGGQLVQSLVVRDVADWSESAQRIRAAWEAEGWMVSDVFSVERPNNPYFRADREDGAKLAFDANEEGLILKVESPCSTDATMSTKALKFEERDAYLQEMLGQAPGGGKAN